MYMWKDLSSPAQSCGSQPLCCPGFSASPTLQSFAWISPGDPAIGIGAMNKTEQEEMHKIVDSQIVFTLTHLPIWGGT